MTENNRAERGAGTARPVDPETLRAFKLHRELIIEKTVGEAMRREEEIRQHGDDAARLLTSGMQFTFKMLEAAMSFGELALLDDEVRWALERLPHDGVLPGHLISRFVILRRVIGEVLRPEHRKQIVPYLEWMESRIAHGASPETSFIAD